MNNYAYRILAVIFLLLPIGCATIPLGDSFTTISEPRDGQALVYIYRPYVKPASAINLIVEVDGSEVGKVPVNGFVELYLDEGKHDFVFTWPAMAGGLDVGWSDLELKSEATYFMKYTVEATAKFLSTKWRYKVDLIDAKDAIPELEMCCKAIAL